jgi:hypothetical protein
MLHSDSKTDVEFKQDLEHARVSNILIRLGNYLFLLWEFHLVLSRRRYVLCGPSPVEQLEYHIFPQASPLSL